MNAIFVTVLGLTFWALALVLFVCILFYFLPAFIAAMRGHPQTGLITLINLLLGWTMLGWLAALVWALLPGRFPGSGPTPPSPVSPRGRPMKTVN